MEYHAYQKVKDTVHPSLRSDKLDNLMQYCRTNQVLFLDKEFPPNQGSLIGNPPPADYKGQFKVVEWKRASELFGEGTYDVFRGIAPTDIRQGSLGNCYFLCSLSSLAEHPQLISRLFDFDHVNEHGVQAVWLNINGIWTRYILDEYFPSYFNGVRNDLAFSKTDQKELWVILLEKAYAKAYGSYWEIVGGDPVHALRDLTGAPYDRVEDFANLDAAWQKMFDANLKNYILTCFTKSTAIREEKSATGIVAGHAYSILDVRDIINSQGNPARVLQIRNPWGKFEWNGEYSDSSNLWTPQQRQELKIVAADDGIFWMKLEDFLKHFEGVGILKIVPTSLSNGVKVDNQSSTMIRMQVPQASHMTIGIDQLDSRIVDNPDYSYSYFRITIGKLNGKLGITFVDTILSPERNVFIENNFPPGDYIILIEAYWSTNLVKSFNVSTYSENDVELELLPLSTGTFKNSEHLIWKDFAKRNLQTMTKKSSRVAGTGNMTTPVETYQYQNKKYANVLYAFANRGNANSVHQSISYKNSKGFNSIGQNSTENGAELIINPQDVDILLFKMDPRSQGFSLAHQITDEEVVPYKFTENVAPLEQLNALGGSQPTPENPRPSIMPRQQKQTEIQNDNQKRGQFKEQLKREKEEKRQQKLLKKQKLIEEKQRADQERSRRNPNTNNQNTGGYGGLLDQAQGFLSHLGDRYGGQGSSHYMVPSNQQPNNGKTDLFGGQGAYGKFFNDQQQYVNPQPYNNSGQKKNDDCVIF